MKVAVISDRTQFEELTRRYPGMCGVNVVCDNLAFQGFLREKGVEFTLLEEGLLRDRWDQINTWACDKALNWGDILKEDKELFGGIEMNRAMYVYFSYYLIAFVKNYLYARYIYEHFHPEEVVVFEAARGDFPRFNGNYLINMFLRELSDEHGCEVVMLGRAPSDPVRGDTSLKERTKDILKSVYSRMRSAGGGRSVFLACGSLRHLSSVMKSMKKLGHDVIMYDFDLHLEQLNFCLREGISYIVPDSVLQRGTNGEERTFDAGADIPEILGRLKRTGWFRFFGDDLTDMICDEIREAGGRYFDAMSRDAEVYNGILSRYRAKGVILDEDWSPARGFMAAFFRSRGVKTFCVSHGYGAQRFSVEEDKRNFFLSETLVNSGYEVQLYGARGWDSSHVHVTGSPKYDRLAEISRKKGGSKPVIMFCGTSLRELAVNEAAYIGVTQFERGSYMRECLKKTLKAAKGYDVKLIVRPHPSDIATGADDKSMWMDLISEYGEGADVGLDNASGDFYDLLAECDAMVVGYWTPAIVEALLAGVPALVINPDGLGDGFPFAKEGLCESADDISRVRYFVGKVCDAFHDGGHLPVEGADPEKKDFYLGRGDADNTRRAVEKILELAARQETTGNERTQKRDT